jgi:hypothetical protein
LKTTRVLHAGPADEAGAEAPRSAAVQTPSQAIVAAAGEIIRVQDGRGRVLGFRILNWLDRANFAKILGPHSDNDAYRNEILPAYLSVEIDGRMLGRPASERDLMGRMSVLGDEGQAAISAELVRRFAPRAGRRELTEAVAALAERFAPEERAEEMAAVLLLAAEPYVADDEEAAVEDTVKNA